MPLIMRLPDCAQFNVMDVVAFEQAYLVPEEVSEGYAVHLWSLHENEVHPRSHLACCLL